MKDIKLGQAAFGCSNLANTSRGRNKIIRKLFAFGPLILSETNRRGGACPHPTFV